MMNYLLISRIVLSSHSLLLLIEVSIAQDLSVCSSWESDYDSDNNLDQSIILWEKIERPFIDCALYCGMDSSCRSFFYNPSLETCLGSLSYKRGLPDNQAVQQGWNYYTRPQHCDGDYIYNETLKVCYKFHNETRANCSYAMNVCETEEAKLLILYNDNQLLYFSSLNPGHPLWIGLRRSIKNTEWRWWNGQTAINVSWSYGYSFITSNALCAFIYQGYYGNIDIPDLKLYFLCQRHI